MKLSEELQWRGFVNQTTFADMAELDGDPITFYWGVDPSADSMTIGNLAPAMMIRHFIAHGHKAFLLVGGATGLIGDPDGKKDERELKTLDTVARNKAALAKEYSIIFSGMPFELVDNYDWFKDISYLSFLRDVGKYVSLSSMLGREFVQARIGENGSGISYAEFSYSLIQGYDFLHLYRTHGVTLQVCGADQWGNSIAGVDLIRRIEGGEANIYSTPLVINKSTGVKFGKSEGGAIWLNPSKTSVYKFYQFWLNVEDEGVIDYLKIYTLLSKDEIESIERQHLEAPYKRIAQRRLAEEVTRIVHGEERLQSVIKVTRVLFDELSMNEIGTEELDQLAQEIPTVRLGTTVIEALVTAGIAKSNSEAQRLIQAGAISVNGEKVEADTTIDTIILVKKGKNAFILVR